MLFKKNLLAIVPGPYLCLLAWQRDRPLLASPLKMASSNLQRARQCFRGDRRPAGLLITDYWPLITDHSPLDTCHLPLVPP